MNSYRFEMSLRLFTKSLDLDEICSQIGYFVERKWKNGEPKTSPTGRQLGGMHDESYCSLQVPREKEDDIGRALDRATDRLVLHSEQFRKVHLEGGRAEILIGWFIESNAGAILGSDVLRRLANLNLDLSLDLYGEKICRSSLG